MADLVCGLTSTSSKMKFSRLIHWLKTINQSYPEQKEYFKYINDKYTVTRMRAQILAQILNMKLHYSYSNILIFKINKKFYTILYLVHTIVKNARFRINEKRWEHNMEKQTTGTHLHAARVKLIEYQLWNHFFCLVCSSVLTYTTRDFDIIIEK